ncbi:hypothetical protein CEXT_522821 [Caerostris extrusa]|uniref:Uncharacterized protein n=1 Tax=Caerostris extrusa TaxID=172846 RepID=A0AAV4NRG0_CAEEX|nr:hypothetical protein CEXT_522821 [Caerostris extrusa]
MEDMAIIAFPATFDMHFTRQYDILANLDVASQKGTNSFTIIYQVTRGTVLKTPRLLKDNLSSKLTILKYIAQLQITHHHYRWYLGTARDLA